MRRPLFRFPNRSASSILYRFMNKGPILLTLIGSTFGLAAPLAAQTNIVSEPLGFNSVPCFRLSDTIVGVPFRPNGSQQGSLSGAPSDYNSENDTVNLTLSGSPGFDPDGDPVINGSNGEFANTHYVKFSSGDADGRFYPVTANGTNTLTIALNGDNIPAAVLNDTIVIAAYWTLNTLFPPLEATTNFTENPPGSGNFEPNGHAIVASTSRFSSGRMTEVWLPDLETRGTNIAPNQTFYIYDNGWRKQNESYLLDFGDTQLHPDIYIIIRHTEFVQADTVFKTSGEVELGSMTIPLSTNNLNVLNDYQDNFVAIPRPVPVTISQLGLHPGAFEESTNRFASGRKDELILFGHDQVAFNKTAVATYYYINQDTNVGWRKVNESHLVDFGNDPVPAGFGFMVRKAPTEDGATSFWENKATYDNQP
jgi:uncharacterized protein (TIGR02597 family)